MTGAVVSLRLLGGVAQGRVLMRRATRLHPGRGRAVRVTALVATALMVTAACSSNSSGGASGGSTEGTPVRGGTLNMLGPGDVDYMDPNVSYYSTSYSVLRLWSRQLFTYPGVEGEATTAAPDLA